MSPTLTLCAVAMLVGTVAFALAWITNYDDAGYGDER